MSRCQQENDGFMRDRLTNGDGDSCDRHLIESVRVLFSSLAKGTRSK
jgi:hypothetical protein